MGVTCPKRGLVGEGGPLVYIRDDKIKVRLIIKLIYYYTQRTYFVPFMSVRFVLFSFVSFYRSEWTLG